MRSALSIIAIVTFGNASVERMFAYVSYLLYAVYALFVVLAFSRFGDEIQAAFASETQRRKLGGRAVPSMPATI